MKLMDKLRWWPVHNFRWADGTVFQTRYTLVKHEPTGYLAKDPFGETWRETFTPAWLKRLLLTPWSLKVHRFRRDDETAHDHPWKFASLIVWRHYDEDIYTVHDGVAVLERTLRRRFLSFDSHWADHTHRVKVQEGKDCWTLCLTWGREREWGFWEQPDAIGRLRRWVHNVEHGEETGRHRVTY